MPSHVAPAIGPNGDDDYQKLRVNSRGELKLSRGLVPADFDRVDVTYPSSTSEVYAFKLSGVTVATVTITYTDTKKESISSAVRS